MTMTEEQARSAALSLKVVCHFGKNDCMNTLVCDCPFRGPPAENSAPSGATDSKDGQGVSTLPRPSPCELRYIVSFQLLNGSACATDPLSWQATVERIEVCIAAGVESFTVEVA